ncbi:hypothetical protein QTP86_027469, partial [Hemibagrus guttatus]
MSSKGKTVGASAPGIPSPRDDDPEPSSEEDEGLETDGPDTGHPPLSLTNCHFCKTLHKDDVGFVQCEPYVAKLPTHRRAHTLSFTHTITHYRQGRDANQPTMHVFGLGEETEAPGGNPRGTGRTCKLHTLGGGGNRAPNPGVVHSSLQDLVLPEGAVVLQYADDLLISAETAGICKEATWSLLNHLAQQGFKAAELVTLTRACILSADKDVTIYTDSRYAFRVAHDFGRIWQTRGFVSAE